MIRILNPINRFDASFRITSLTWTQKPTIKLGGPLYAFAPPCETFNRGGRDGLGRTSLGLDKTSFPTPLKFVSGRCNYTNNGKGLPIQPLNLSVVGGTIEV